MQGGIDFFERAHDRAGIVNGIRFRIGRCDVDQMQQQARALQMTQKPVAESRTFGGAFDQSRNIGDDEAAVVIGPHDPELRRERRERIIGDFRPRCRDGADQRRLSGVRHAQ